MIRKRQEHTLPVYILRRSRLFLWRLIRQATAHWRVLPNFVIIGVQKGGTTSLYQYLENHPNVQVSFKKEIKYFDCNFHHSLSWYRSHFPTIRRMRKKRPAITGEASPYYIFHPWAAERLASTIPHARLILLLRNPVERAYSHYQHNVRTGREKLSFEDAIAAEPERLAGIEERIIADPSYPLFKHMHYSYLTKGIYLSQIKRWHQHFPREQLLIMPSETLYANPGAALRQVECFLGIPHYDFSNLKPYNVGEYAAMKSETRRQLEEFFRPHNEQLSEYLEANYHWM